MVATQSAEKVAVADQAGPVARAVVAVDSEGAWELEAARDRLQNPR